MDRPHAPKIDIFANAPRVAEREASNIAETIDAINNATEPVILRGLASEWPVVKAAKTSDQALIDYLMQFDKGASVPVSVGPPSINGRLFYNDAFTGMNAERGNSRFDTLLQRVLHYGRDANGPTVYMASMDLADCVPGFEAENDIAFRDQNPRASIWIGTGTRIAAHNDLPQNIACVAAGRRRFTLFPPDQTANLYPGPFELTPAGRPISLVDFHNPDFEIYPRFSEALKTAQVAELEAGDAIFIPSMWWHHVEALSKVNVLVNYWWRNAPKHAGTPQDVLNHAMLTLRDLPPAEKKIWRDIFDYYVFETSDETANHIPEHARGILNPIDEAMAKRVRGFLRARLDR